MLRQVTVNSTSSDKDVARFVELFAKGLVPGGSYWQWIHAWRRVRSDRVLWVHFEDLKRDTATQVRRIVEFLGLDKVVSAEQDIAAIVRNSSFEAMKQMVRQGRDTYPIDFFRKGVVGDHKHALTREQMDTLDMITHCAFHSTDIRYWRPRPDSSEVLK